MSIHEALKFIRDNPQSRHKNYGICANLTMAYNPKNDPDKQLEQQKFIRAAFTTIYGNNYSIYPIEKGYTEYYLNTDKWDSSTEYGKARLELLDKMIDLSFAIDNLPVFELPVKLSNSFPL